MSARTLEDTYRLLEEPIVPHAIYQREGAGGMMLSYVPGDYSVDRANHIFGALNWDHRITHIKQVSLEEVEGKYGLQWLAIYECTVEVCVHVPGLAIEVIKSGSACGSGKGKSKADACHSAITESETDSLKRALRLYGGSLGQQLYRKQGNLGELPGRLSDPLEMTDRMRMFVEGIEGLETMEKMQALVDEIKANESVTHDERIELRVRLKNKYVELRKGA